MDKMKKRDTGHIRRKRRVRAKVSGTAERPRLCVTRTNTNIYAQVIDDTSGNTIVSASTLDKEFKDQNKTGGNLEAAEFVGNLVGKRAVEAGITSVVFDRSGRIYHGRVKALADAARDAGLKF